MFAADVFDKTPVRFSAATPLMNTLPSLLLTP
jgi:hypothetical protein